MRLSATLLIFSLGTLAQLAVLGSLTVAVQPVCTPDLHSSADEDERLPAKPGLPLSLPALPETGGGNNLHLQFEVYEGSIHVPSMQFQPQQNAPISITVTPVWDGTNDIMTYSKEQLIDAA